MTETHAITTSDNGHQYAATLNHSGYKSSLKLERDGIVIASQIIHIDALRPYLEQAQTLRAMLARHVPIDAGCSDLRHDGDEGNEYNCGDCEWCMAYPVLLA